MSAATLCATPHVRPLRVSLRCGHMPLRATRWLRNFKDEGAMIAVYILLGCSLPCALLIWAACVLGARTDAAMMQSQLSKESEQHAEQLRE
jgi:hypothetical protein